MFIENPGLGIAGFYLNFLTVVLVSSFSSRHDSMFSGSNASEPFHQPTTTDNMTPRLHLVALNSQPSTA
jgi:hypothetical protein